MPAVPDASGADRPRQLRPATLRSLGELPHEAYGMNHRGASQPTPSQHTRRETLSEQAFTIRPAENAQRRRRRGSPANFDEHLLKYIWCDGEGEMIPLLELRVDRFLPQYGAQ